MNSKAVQGFIRACALAFVSFQATAAVITVEATGTIYRGYDHAGSLVGSRGSLRNHTVISTWTFDTNDVPSDLNHRSDVGSYRDYANSINWIDASVRLTGSSGAVNETDFPDADVSNYERDYVVVQDNLNSRDHYSIGSYGRAVGTDTNTLFNSYAYFYDYLELDVLTNDSLDQTFTWTREGADYGYGHFQIWDLLGNERAYGNFVVDSMRSYTRSLDVPEPTSLLLLGLGLIGLGLMRRKNQS